MHDATARHDGEWEVASFWKTYSFLCLCAPSSSRAVTSAVVSVNIRIVCEKEPRDLPDK